MKKREFIAAILWSLMLGWIVVITSSICNAQTNNYNILDKNSQAIVGGSVNNAPIGNTTPSTIVGTSVTDTSLSTGLILGSAFSPFTTYGGTSCTNQFPRSLSALGVATCASVSLTSDISSAGSTAYPGTVSITTTAVTGSSTKFTNWFKPGDTITATTTSGAETQSVVSIASDTAMTTSAFAGTASSVTYTSSNGGVSQTIFNNNGTIRLNGSTGTGDGSLALIQDSSTYSVSQSIVYVDYDAFPTVNVTAGSPGVYPFNSFATVSNTGGGTVTQYGIKSRPTIAASNTGSQSIYGAYFVPVITAGATGTMNSAGVAIGAPPGLATNSTILLLGTPTIPSGVYGIYQSGTAANSFGGAITSTTINGTTAVQVNGAALNPVLSGTTGSIGGGALIAGACASGTAVVTGSTTAMTVQVSPNTYEGDGFYEKSYVSSNGTVTVKVCAAITGTPTASTYNVRVTQ